MALETLRTLLAEQFGVDPKTITAETAFVEDLGADSLDMVELMMSIEEEFDVGTLDEDAAAGVKTVADVLRLLGEEE